MTYVQQSLSSTSVVKRKHVRLDTVTYDGWRDADMYALTQLHRMGGVMRTCTP